MQYTEEQLAKLIVVLGQAECENRTQGVTSKELAELMSVAIDAHYVESMECESCGAERGEECRQHCLSRVDESDLVLDEEEVTV